MARKRRTRSNYNYRRTKKRSRKQNEKIGKAIFWIFFGWWFYLIKYILLFYKFLFWDCPVWIVRKIRNKNNAQQTVNNSNVNNINRLDEVIYNPPQQRTNKSEQLTPKQTGCFLAIFAVFLIACVIIGTIVAFNN